MHAGHDATLQDPFKHTNMSTTITELRGGTHWTILGPDYGPGSDSAESYRDQPDYKNRHSEEDSTTPTWITIRDDCGEKREYSDISLRSDMGSDYAEDPPMEVEEVLHGDSPADSDALSVVSENDAPPAPTRWPKAPTRSLEEGEEAIPVPTLETGKVAGAPLVAGQQRLPPPKS
ncbi:hypothetical protein P4O66_010876, partial [Electrophorus voltai]